jgi:hypothetical protein
MNKRVDNLEFRYAVDNRSPEIVCWEKNEQGSGEYCYTLLFYDRCKEGFNVRFVGARPFEYENQERLWALMRYGDRVLDALFRLENDL